MYLYNFYNWQFQSGCESPRVPVAVNITPIAPITIAGNTIVCSGGNTTLSVDSPEAGVDYTWMPGNTVATSITVSPTDSTVYTVTGVNASGCTSTATVNVAVNPYPAATASGNSPVFMGDDIWLSATGGTSYVWSGPNSFSSTDQNPVVTNAVLASGGIYTVIATSNGCSDTATVDITVVDPTQPLTGNYTINQTAPASPINFTSFTSAATFLNTAGVAGPVTINVVPTTSPYTSQQFHLGSIPGASATNTVTIYGNGETLTFCSNDPSNRDIVRLDGTSWLRLYNLNIEGTCGYGWGIHMLNGASNNLISGNTITVNGTSPNLAFHQGIIAANSFVDPQAFGNAATNIRVVNNTVNGGYTGIRFNGSEAAPSTGLVIDSNTVNNAYEYGIYVLYNNAPMIRSNTVSMRAGNPRSMGVMINRIEDGITFTGNHVMNAGRRSVYMNYVNRTTNTVGLVANNMIAGGLQNQAEADGLYLNFTNHLNVYHNSTLTDNAGTGYSFAVTNWGSRYVNVFNNSFAYTGGGTGYAVAVGAGIMDYNQDDNNYYTNGSKFSRMGNADRGNLTDLRSAPNLAGLHDQNSMDLNPQYVGAYDLHLQSTSPLINAIASIAAVTHDFDGQLRQALTDIGADETGTAPRTSASDLTARVYPNPFSNTLNLVLEGNAEGKVQVALVDMMGREVYRNSFAVTAGPIVITPEVQLAQGVYMLQVTNNGVTSQFRVVKQ